MTHQTIQSEIRLNGVGIHSGKAVSCCLKPATVSDGLSFYRTDTGCVVHVSPQNIGLTAVRATRLSDKGTHISTPEHILAGLNLCGVTCCRIEVDAEECPILDGSALPIVQAILKVGIRPLPSAPEPVLVQCEHRLTHNEASLIIAPYDGFKIRYESHYPNSFLGRQSASWELGITDGLREIAPARTYGFTHEIEALQKNGLGLGGSIENVLVIDDNKYLNPARFDNECPRHKVLDVLGDFMILGRPIKGEIIANASGHQLNLDMVRYLADTYPV